MKEEEEEDPKTYEAVKSTSEDANEFDNEVVIMRSPWQHQRHHAHSAFPQEKIQARIKIDAAALANSGLSNASEMSSSLRALRAATKYPWEDYQGKSWLGSHGAYVQTKALLQVYDRHQGILTTL